MQDWYNCFTDTPIPFKSTSWFILNPVSFTTRKKTEDPSAHYWVSGCNVGPLVGQRFSRWPNISQMWPSFQQTFLSHEIRHPIRTRFLFSAPIKWHRSPTWEFPLLILSRVCSPDAAPLRIPNFRFCRVIWKVQTNTVRGRSSVLTNRHLPF